MKNEAINPIVKSIAHSMSKSFHQATVVNAANIGTLIFSNLGQVINPLGGCSRYGVPGILSLNNNFLQLLELRFRPWHQQVMLQPQMLHGQA